MLIQSAKMTALGELASSVAHELNQPLNDIKLITQGILRNLERGRFDPSTFQADGRDMIQIIDRMAGIVNYVRVFTRKPEQNLRIAVDINDATSSGLKLLREQFRLSGVKLVEELAPGLDKVVGDPNNVQQIIVNLLTNARDAVLERMSKDHDWRGQISIRTYACGDGKLCLEVRDNGPGMAEGVKQRLFEPFFTTKTRGRGTGLGLPIAQRVAAEYSGWIEVESSPGDGATFRVVLPTCTDAPSQQPVV